MKHLLAPKLKDTFNYVLETGETPPSWREAVISLISKEGKDNCECGSYWPISVLNQDYKIFTHILTKILTQIISLDQTQDNIRQTLQVIEHNRKQTPGGVTGP